MYTGPKVYTIGVHGPLGESSLSRILDPRNLPLIGLVNGSDDTEPKTSRWVFQIQAFWAPHSWVDTLDPKP